MADGSGIESSLLMDATTAPSTLAETAVVQIVSDAGGGVAVANDEHVAEDILQQAFVEAEDFAPNGVDFTTGETAVDASVAAEIVNNVMAEGNLVTTVAVTMNETPVYAEAEYAVGTDGVSQVEMEQAVVLEEGNGMVQEEPTEAVAPVIQTIQDSQSVVSEPQQSRTVSVAVIPSSSPHIGTSHNPIRIIQQGNQYTPVQQLTAEQLQQIMQVVQQQQLAKTTSQGGGSSILYNSQTNTRIVYRVIYPSELHKSTSSTTQSDTQGQDAMGNVHKRPYKRRLREDDEDKVDGPELSKEEKEERKKHRPRTRSGRVSKPPKHMMKDYKHIHVLDWDEDYDDSDGGYSDYKCSDEERKNRERSGDNEEHGELAAAEKDESSLVYPGLGSTRPKNHKCETCDKAYIGQAGLGRHYRLYPTHGTMPEIDDTEKSQDGTGRINGNIGSLSEDSNTQDSFPGLETSTMGSPSPLSKRGGMRGRGRGRHLQELSHSRRKTKLKELVSQCEDEDLMEVVLPRLAKVITLYEFLLMKVEKGYPYRPHADDIYHQFETLHQQVQKVCKTYLSPFANTTPNEKATRSLQVKNPEVAQALGLEIGRYEVKEMPTEEIHAFRTGNVSTDIPLCPSSPRQQVRRRIQVTPDHVSGQPVNKRQRTMSLMPDVKNNSAATYVTKSAPSTMQFRVVSASSPSAATVATPHIIAVSNPQIVNMSNSNVLAGPQTRIVSVSNHGVSTVSNPKYVSVLNPNIIAAAAAPRLVTVAGNSVSRRAIVSESLSQQAIVSESLSQQAIVSESESAFVVTDGLTSCVQADIQPPETSIQIVPQVGGEEKSHEILSSQAAATSALETNNMETNSTVDGVVASVANTISANMVLNSDAATVNSASNSAGIQSALRVVEPPPTALRTMLLNGSIPNENAKQLQPLVEGGFGSDVQNIQVVGSLEEAQQLVLAQCQMNNGDLSTNINTLADVVQNESAQQQQAVEDSDVKSEVILNPLEVKNEITDSGEMQDQVVSVEQSEGQIVTHSNIYQTEDGILIIQNPDGTTFQLQGAEGVPLETLQALLAMEGQFETGEPVQAELQ